MTIMNMKTNNEDKTFEKKIEEVKEKLRALKRVLVAFSGISDACIGCAYSSFISST